MNIWDKTKPLPSEYINTFYDYLRNLKELFLDRFGLDHNMDGVLDTTLVTADGYHNQLTMRDYEDVDEYQNPIYYPWYTEDSQQLFVKLIDGLHELCVQNSDGIYQATSSGRIVPEMFNLAQSFEEVIEFNGYLFGRTRNTSPSLYRSEDGEAWTLIGSDAYCFAILNGYLFIGASINGYNGIQRTSDGVSFSCVHESNGCFFVTFINNLYFALVNSGSAMYSIYSVDGVSWLNGTANLGSSSFILKYRVYYYNSRYYYISQSYSYSDNLTFTDKQVLPFYGDSIFFNGVFVGVARSGISPYGAKIYSTADFSSITIQNVASGTTSSYLGIVTEANGKLYFPYIVASTSTCYLLESSDGINFNIIYTGTNRYFSTIFVESTYVACSDGYFFYSTDLSFSHKIDHSTTFAYYDHIYYAKNKGKIFFRNRVVTKTKKIG